MLKHVQTDLGMSILLITHDLGVVSEMCDRVIVMYAGRIVEEAQVDALFDNPKHPYTQGLIRSIPQLGEKIDSLFSIRGQVPPPSQMPKGCKFAPRCHKVMSICSEKEPPLMTDEKGGRCSCWLYEEDQDD